MSDLSFREQIQRQINKAHRAIRQYAYTDEDKEHNARCELKIKYYTERLGFSACVSYEEYVTSWAGKNWLAKQKASV